MAPSITIISKDKEEYFKKNIILAFFEGALEVSDILYF